MCNDIYHIIHALHGGTSVSSIYIETLPINLVCIPLFIFRILQMCFLHLWTCLIVNQILFHWEVFICTMELENIPNLTSDVHHRLDQKALNSADILWTITASAIIFMSTGIGVKKGQDLKPHLLIIIIFHDQCSLIVSFYT